MGWYIELLGGELYCFVQCKSWESSPYLIMFRLTLFSLLTSFYAAVLERSAVAAKDAGSWSWPRYGVRQRVAVALVELLVSSSWAHLFCLWPRTRQHEHVRSSVVCSEGESMWGCLTWAVFSPFPDPTTWAYLANVAKYVHTQRLYCYILLTKIVSGKQQEIIIFNPVHDGSRSWFLSVVSVRLCTRIT